MMAKLAGEQREKTLQALDDFGLVESDAERLLEWIEQGYIPNVAVRKDKPK